MYSPTDLHGYVLFKQKYGICDAYKNIKKSNGYIGGYAERCSSFECWSNIPSLMQAWIWYLIPALFGYFAAKRHQ